MGILGFALPTLLFLFDWVLLRSKDLVVRGSLSAYYHSGVRDLFVGILCITGFMLIAYMLGQRSTRMDKREAALSTIAGAGALLVALLPTTRPGLLDGMPRCGPHTSPAPEGCTLLQQLLGEDLVAKAHFVSAGTFIGFLALICVLIFAKREQLEGHEDRKRLHLVCGWTIAGAIVWAIGGSLLHLVTFGWTALLVGEVVAVYFFSFSWMIRSHDLLPRPLTRALKILGIS